MKSKRKIPKVPFFRIAKNVVFLNQNPFMFLHENFVDLGNSFSINVWPFGEAIFSRSADFTEYVLQKNQKNYNKGKLQTVDLVRYVGRGLFTSEAEHWRKQRKLIQPAFHKKQLSNLLESIKEAILLEYAKIEDDKTIDIFPILNDLAFQTVVKSLFSGAASIEQIKRLQYNTETIQQGFLKELRQPHMRWWFKINGFTDKHLKLAEDFRSILKEIVNERRASKVKYNDLLDMLIEAKYEDGSTMDEEQLIDEILIIFIAGHETTSNTLTFTLELLALHPEWQERIYEEIKSNEDKHDDLMGLVMSSKLCQQVIEESLRLYPPAYIIGRSNINNDTFDAMEFSANSTLIFSIYEIHRHPELWKNPDDFMPERFDEGGRQYSSHYFPFGAGPRKCIGNNFAMFEMIIAINEIIKRYKISSKKESIETTPLLTLKPKNPFLTFKKR